MKKIKEWIHDNIGTLICIIFIILILALVFGYVWVMVEYGDKPVSEVPAWVLWLMFQTR
jgi:predicted negative regulator of RcsB-dependent stress response